MIIENKTDIKMMASSKLDVSSSTTAFQATFKKHECDALYLVESQDVSRKTSLTNDSRLELGRRSERLRSSHLSLRSRKASGRQFKRQQRGGLAVKDTLPTFCVHFPCRPSLPICRHPSDNDLVAFTPKLQCLTRPAGVGINLDVGSTAQLRT